MKYIAVLLGSLFFVSPLLAETPCDFKGISVGSKMSPAELMSALGVTQYKTNPSRQFLSDQAKKYGLMAAAEIEEWEIGPYCDNNSCRVPRGVTVGSGVIPIPVNVFVSFNEGVITAIDVSFSETFWDEIRLLLDEKYGADWTTERNDGPIINYETKKSRIVQSVVLQHVTKGTNPSTKDHCQIWATQFDQTFEHHDAFGPYHSVVEIKLISKNF